MNLVLFERDEISRPLRADDPRALHLRSVLRRANDEPFDCGIVDGPRGRATITQQDDAGLHLAYEWGAEPPPLDPVWLLVGLPRPASARRILNEVAAFGVAGIIFFPTEKGEPSYASSSLWTRGEARGYLLAGVAQAFCTRVPECRLVENLTAAFTTVPDLAPTRVALDNYEAVAPLAQVATRATPALIAIGAERGWSAPERKTLREAGFVLAHLGRRVLRTETACIAGLAVLKARLGLL